MGADSAGGLLSFCAGCLAVRCEGGVESGGEEGAKGVWAHRTDRNP